MENKLYKKIGKRYEPIGVFYDRDYLTDGLWLVHHKGCGITSVPYLQPSNLIHVGNIPKLSIMELCGTHEYTDAILNSWNEATKIADERRKNKNGYPIGLSQYDMARLAIMTVLKMNQDKTLIDNEKLDKDVVESHASF